MGAGGRGLSQACEDCSALLAAQRVGPERLDWHVEPGAAHNERDWRRRLPRALRWLFGAPLAAENSAGEAFWSRPSPVRAGCAFELYADPSKLPQPCRGQPQVRLGFDTWSRDVQTLLLQPAGLPRQEAAGDKAWLVAMVVAPPGARDLQLAFTNGTDWDNNGGKNYELPVTQG
mmetsp:Transcript_134659/g.430055  ORF Transcript_134659/g.430055 Transcript_134659/m.430055 type:complete len:174 (-) Transcript_134659:150-671(-)